MKIIDFGELHKFDYSVSDILILPQYWQDGRSFSYTSAPRPDHGIMLYTGCFARYASSVDDIKSVVTVTPGDLLYVPKGSRYRVEFYGASTRGGVSDYLVNFLLFDENGEEASLSESFAVFRPDGDRGFSETFSELLLCSRNAAFPKAKIKAMLYNLLSDISLMIGNDKSGSREFSPIRPALGYISENFLSSDIRVSDLSKLCHMSEANFRRVFVKLEGVSPKTYITRLKLERAEVLLSRGDMSVSEVARYVGFEDSSYFVRFYKKNFGVSPGKARG